MSVRKKDRTSLDAGRKKKKKKKKKKRRRRKKTRKNLGHTWPSPVWEVRLFVIETIKLWASNFALSTFQGRVVN